MKDDLQKTKEQLLAELEVLRTKSKEREEQLRAANQQLENFNKQLHAKNKLIEEKRAFAENLLETAPSFIVVLNTQGDIVRFNRFAENLSGYQKEEVLGKNWLTLFIPEEEKHQINTVFKSMLKHIPDFSTNQNKIRLKNGEKRMIQWTNSVLKDEAGNITGILSIGHDITEQLKIQKALEQKKQKKSSLKKNLSQPKANLLSFGLVSHSSIATPAKLWAQWLSRIMKMKMPILKKTWSYWKLWPITSEFLSIASKPCKNSKKPKKKLRRATGLNLLFWPI